MPRYYIVCKYILQVFFPKNFGNIQKIPAGRNLPGRMINWDLWNSSRRLSQRLLLEVKLAFARNEQMTDVVLAAQQPSRCKMPLRGYTTSASLTLGTFSSRRRLGNPIN